MYSNIYLYLGTTWIQRLGKPSATRYAFMLWANGSIGASSRGNSLNMRFLGIESSCKEKSFSPLFSILLTPCIWGFSHTKQFSISQKTTTACLTELTQFWLYLPGDSIRSYKLLSPTRLPHCRYHTKVQLVTSTSDELTINWGPQDPFSGLTIASMAHRTQGNIYLHLLIYY